MSIRMGRKERLHPSMLPMPARNYGYDKYPESLVASFRDGRTKVYEARIKQPRPTFFSVAELKRMYLTVGSYQFKGLWYLR